MPECDVAIVGYGPVGVSAANFLGQYGIRTMVFERDRDIYQRARAVTVNDWTLRAYQSVGLDAELKADMEENGALHWKTYAGKEVFQMTPMSSGLGHPASMMIYQPAMEATLRRGAERFADSVEVRFGEQVTGLEQDDAGVTLTVAAVTSDESYQVRAKYVLACDGGSSRIRRALGIDMAGETREVTWIVVDGEVRRWWPDCKELVFWTDPVRPVVDIPLSKGYHRWEFPLRPDEKPADFESEEALWALLEPMGRTREELELKQHAFYSHHVRHAERWRSGRVMLLGDAAHLMPPWAGQGMQSGIRDAHNLAWKLRDILAGRLDEAILDTYEVERAPQVAMVTDLSKKMGTLIASTDPRFVAVRNAIGPVLMRFRRLVSTAMASPNPTLRAGWLRGATGKRSAIGRMFPQPGMCTAQGHRIRLDDALGGDFAVLGNDVDPRSAMSAADIVGWENLGARFIAIRPGRGSAAGEHDLIDDTGACTAWMAKYHCRVVVVRPDRFVAATDSAGLATPTHSAPGLRAFTGEDTSL